MKRYIDIHVPISRCNLLCDYCYVSRLGHRNQYELDLKYSPETIGKALSIDRLGGISLINICASGETLLYENIVELTYQLLRNGHYVMIVTNGLLISKIRKILDIDDELLNRLTFKLSLHYLELKNKQLLDQFLDTYKLIKKSPCSFTIEVTPSDELIPYIDELKSFCVENFGALCHISIPREEENIKMPLLSKLSLDEFCGKFDSFDSNLMRFKKKLWGVRRTEYCYAGKWSGLLNIGTGELQLCYYSKISQNILDDLSKPIEFLPMGKCCQIPHCYNGHSFLALGTIPEKYCDITYASLRNRKCVDGSEWLNPCVKAFFSEKLGDDNGEVKSDIERVIYDYKKINKLLKKIGRKILKYVKKYKGEN